MQPIKYPGICRGGTAFGILLVGLAYSYALFAAPSTSGQETTMELPKEKQTTLGLYLTAAEAYEKWKAAPDSGEGDRRENARGVRVCRPCGDGLEHSRGLCDLSAKRRQNRIRCAAES